MIAETAVGNKLAGLGLITHFAALIIGMSTFENSGVISVSLYLSSIVMLMGGIVIESRKGDMKGIVLYKACALTIFPVVGPIVALWLTDTHSPKAVRRLLPFLGSLLTLKVNSLLLAIWAVLILLWVGISFLANDPYFKP